jgi:hypothetical protein
VPCISKNLKSGEIPNCFFNQVDPSGPKTGYTYMDFARIVLKKDEERRNLG